MCDPKKYNRVMSDVGPDEFLEPNPPAFLPIQNRRGPTFAERLEASGVPMSGNVEDASPPDIATLAWPIGRAVRGHAVDEINRQSRSAIGTSKALLRSGHLQFDTRLGPPRGER